MPLEIWFDRPFDRRPLDKDIRLTKKDGAPITGGIMVGADEMTWRIFPDVARKQDTVFIRLSNTLVDIAGKNFLDLLDHGYDFDFGLARPKDLRVLLTCCDNKRGQYEAGLIEQLVQFACL